jgi:uncharacterized protein
MTAYYFDTSALIKRHVIEVGSAWVRTITQPKAGHTIFISRLTAVEVVSAVTRRQRGGHLAASQGGAILGHFRRHLTARYQLVEVTQALAAAAMQAARTHGLRAYDAVHLATAIEANRIYLAAGLGPLTLVSADRELNAAAIAEGLTVDDTNTHT